MRILILGGSGMLGHRMFQTLSARFPDTYVTLRDNSARGLGAAGALFGGPTVLWGVDAANFTALGNLLRQHRPSIVVNCVGVIKQRRDAQSPVPCITINSLLPHKLAEFCGEWQGRVIHFSTDCVFTGRKGKYTEEDLSDAEDLYGKTKYLGELHYPHTLTLRTSIIGRELLHRESLLEWFLTQNGKTVRGFQRAWYSGVTTPYLSEVVAELIERGGDLSGLFQVTAATISKFDLLTMIRDRFGLDIDIIPDSELVCDRSMVGEKFRNATGLQCPPWPALIEQLAATSTLYEEWSKQSSETVSR